MPSTSTNKNKNKVVSEEESETSVDESDVSGSEGEYVSWVSWFCNLKGHEFFCEVDDDYIQDDFNLCGLSSQVPYYYYALDLILDVESSHGDKLNEEQNSLVESAAEMLYGLIHARYILTSKGMSVMMEKYKNNEFGTCPRTFCSEQSCLPVGQSDIPRSSYVRIYCPQCEDIYLPRTRYQYGDTYVCHVYYFYWNCFICKLVHLKEASYKSAIDGAYFGSTFPHLFLMTYSHLKPQRDSRTYVPKVFGFKVHKP